MKIRDGHLMRDSRAARKRIPKVESGGQRLLKICEVGSGSIPEAGGQDIFLAPIF